MNKHGTFRGGQLYNRLAVLRTEHGLSRAGLAEVVGVNTQTIGFLERGDYGLSLELALRISEHFGLTVEAIFSLRPLAPMSQQLYPSGGKESPHEPAV